MREIIIKLKVKIRANKKVLFFLFGLAIVGIISGSVFLTILSKSDKLLVEGNNIIKIDSPLSDELYKGLKYSD